jgi:hypothetical protein
MYEMEGPRPGLTGPAHRLLGRLAPPDLLLVLNTRAKRRFPGSSRVPEVAPGTVSVSSSESSSTPPMRTAQEISAADSKIL